MKKCVFVIITVLLLIISLLIGPLDFFTNGFFYKKSNVHEILEDETTEYICLSEQGFDLQFKPSKKHFAGFVINIFNNPTENQGYLNFKISHNNKILEEKILNLSDISSQTDYCVYTTSNLKKDTIYNLNISANNFIIPPEIAINHNYYAYENISDNCFINYAYAESTFQFSEKALFILFIIAIWGFLLTRFFGFSFNKKICSACVFVFLVSVLSWQYMFNSMDNENDSFESFQKSSEMLVVGTLYAEHYGVENPEPYYLGFYTDASGTMHPGETRFLSDENWEYGYHNSHNQILFSSNKYTKQYIPKAKSILFSNGEKVNIIDYSDDNKWIVLSLDAQGHLSYSRCGNLRDAVLYDADGNSLPSGQLQSYQSQFGLQGMVMRYLSKFLKYEEGIIHFKFILSLLASIVFVVIVFLINKKYNSLLAGCFFITFWLSPWIVNFAKILYWVEFTWFIPMAVGLFCSININNKKCRIISYILTTISIMIKCLCGYEYISTIMIGLICFMIVDFIVALVNKEKQLQILLFKTIIILGISAITGFVMALFIHGYSRGNKDIIEGIKSIITTDVLRRTNGGQLSDFSESLWPSLNSSVWEVVCIYFDFSTNVITGIRANMFPLLCLIPLGIFAYQYYHKNLDIQSISMYVIFFISAISWFCLAKAHSYVHTHMNYVLWYFGFVQICIYVIAKPIWKCLLKISKK